MSKAFKKMMKEKQQKEVDKQITNINVEKLQQVKQRNKQNIFDMFPDQDDSSEEEIEQENQNQELENQQNKDIGVNEQKDKQQQKELQIINQNQETQQNKDQINEIEQKDKDQEDLDKINKKEENSQKQKKKRKKKKKKKKKKIEEDFEIKSVEEQNEETQLQNKEIVLKVSKKKFNYNKEFSKYFGGAQLVESQDLSKYSKKQQKMIKHQMKINKPKKKYYLVHNQDAIQKLKYKLDCQLKEIKNKYKIFNFKAENIILDLKESFNSVRNTMDPNVMMDFVHTNPYYPESLYAMAEYFRLQGNFKEANFFMEKLIFFFEESLSYEFKIFDEDKSDKNEFCILDIKENTFNLLFFKVLFKFMLILLQKSCYKTSFELNKFILLLNPLQDPLGSLVMIDHTALISRQNQWLIDFTKYFGQQFIKEGTSLLLYPNFLYNYSLAQYEINYGSKKYEFQDLYNQINDNMFDDIFNWKWEINNDNPNFWLSLGILLFPKLLKDLLKFTELEKQSANHHLFKDHQKDPWSKLLEHQIFSKVEKQYLYPFLNIVDENGIQGLFKVIEIFPERNKSLWKSNKVNQWMKAVCGGLINYIEKNNINIEDFNSQLVMQVYKTLRNEQEVFAQIYFTF